MAPGSDQYPWFSAGGTPLRWAYLPIGCLHDWVQGGQGLLRLTVHFRGYPRDLLPEPAIPGASGGGSIAALYQAQFFNSLKESTYACCGSAHTAQALPNEDKARLRGVYGQLCRGIPAAIETLGPSAGGPMGRGAGRRLPQAPAVVAGRNCGDPACRPRHLGLTRLPLGSGQVRAPQLPLMRRCWCRS